MPWRRMRLRNAEVLARCAEDGELVSKGGRVEIRYKPNDGRAYFAAASNLRPSANTAIEPDSFCGPGEAVKKASKASTKSPAAPAPEKPSAPASATNKAWKSLGKKATCFKCGACCLGMARPPSIHDNCNMCK